jgi:hypothetical protein
MVVEGTSDIKQARDCQEDRIRLCVEQLQQLIPEQAWELCRTGHFNLSYASLTSYEARQKLCDLKSADPEFWQQLTQKKVMYSVVVGEDVAEDEVDGAAVFEDDSDIPCEAIIANTLRTSLVGIKLTATGNIVSAAAAESLEASEDSSSVGIMINNPVPSVDGSNLRHGKRKHMWNTLYNSKAFWRHNDNNVSDDEGGS